MLAKCMSPHNFLPPLRGAVLTCVGAGFGGGPVPFQQPPLVEGCPLTQPSHEVAELGIHVLVYDRGSRSFAFWTEGGEQVVGTGCEETRREWVKPFHLPSVPTLINCSLLHPNSTTPALRLVETVPLPYG